MQGCMERGGLCDACSLVLVKASEGVPCGVRGGGTWRISGLMYIGVPMVVLATSIVAVSCLAMPRSPSCTRPVRVRKMFHTRSPCRPALPGAKLRKCANVAGQELGPTSQTPNLQVRRWGGHGCFRYTYIRPQVLFGGGGTRENFPARNQNFDLEVMEWKPPGWVLFFGGG